MTDAALSEDRHHTDSHEPPPGAHDSTKDTRNSHRTVSFNKDVHVKRFGKPRPPPNPPTLAEPTVRKKSLDGFTKEQLAEEAAKVLKQASSTHCSSSGNPDKFYSLPNRRKHKPRPDVDSYFPTRRRSEELGVTSDLPKKTNKSVARSNSDVTAKKQRKIQKSPLLNFLSQPKKVTVKRSKSDVSDLKSNSDRPRVIRKRAGSESEEYLNSVIGKKSQLSPIIEVNQSDDYFKKKKPTDKVQKVVLEVDGNQKTARVDKLKEVILSKDYKVNPIEKPPRTLKPPVRPLRSKTVTEKDIAAKNKKTAQVFGTLPKAKPQKKLLIDEVDARNKDINKKEIKQAIKEVIDSLEKSKEEKSLDMIHSSQRPPEKLPLTKGQTVDNMVRILNSDKFSPPPKASLIMPPNVAAHNNNQPFSYTKPSVSPDPNLYIRSLSPDRIPSPVNKSPIAQGVIYAQVVCENGHGSKQTVHTTISPGRTKFGQISDEDEGLGYEDNKFSSSKYIDQTDYRIAGESYKSNDDYMHPDSPITPRYNNRRFEDSYEDSYLNRHYDSHNYENFDKARNDKPFDNERKIAELSYRRDLLESRLNARRLRDRSLSPGEINVRQTSDRDIGIESKNKYVTETLNKQYDEGKDDNYYLSETKYMDRERTLKSKYNKKESLLDSDSNYEMDRREFIDRRLAEEPLDSSYFTNIKTRKYFPPEPEYEPPSLDSQNSRSKYSPDGRKFKSKTGRYTSQEVLHKYSHKQKDKFNSSRERYASNPEIAKREEQYDASRPETYHNSLKRQRYGMKTEERRSAEDNSGPESSKSRYDGDNKLVDSGIENDYRKNSNSDIRRNKKYNKNDSEDEGFASSLLISKKGYDENSTLRRDNFVHRERSIDDGSFYDPRIDKFEPKSYKPLNSKPPKATKKVSGLEKVKQLFSRDSSKKSKKEKTKSREDLLKEDDLHRRYTEYKGTSSGEEYRERDSVDRINGHSSDIDYGMRRRLATPDHSPKESRTDTLQRSKGWFKSLDRLATKKTKSSPSESPSARSNLSTKKYQNSTSSRPVTKNLRFFGDSDSENNSKYLDTNKKKLSSSVQALDRSNFKESYRSSSSMGNLQSAKAFGSRQNMKYSNNKRNLHNINEIHSNSESEGQFDDTIRKQTVYKQHSYELDSRKPPLSPYRDQRSRSQSSSKNTRPIKHGYSNGDLRLNEDIVGSKNDLRSRRRRVHNGVHGSPGDSSTEGESSHQSQKSIVYLHAATVGDIPVRKSKGKMKDEGSTISLAQPQSRTVTRSFSVLAPWKPRYYKEGYDINYSQTQSSTLKRGGKKDSPASVLSKASSSRYDDAKKDSSSTLTRYSNNTNRKVRSGNSSSKENLDDINVSRNTLTRDGYSRTPKRTSTERERVSRSISMPKDPNKSAGWFRINKKTKSTNRLY